MSRTGKFHIISNETFQRMQEVNRVAVNQWQRKEIRNDLLNAVEEALGRKFRLAKKAALVIEEIIWKASDRGYSFNGRETLANKLGVSLRTVDNAIKLLKESTEVIVAYRENPHANGARTPVCIFKRHANFGTIASICGLDCNEVCEVKQEDNPTDTSDTDAKSVSTNIFTYKQEKDNKKKSIHKLSKVIEYITHKVTNVFNRNPYGIKYLGAYIEKVLRKEQQRALYEASRGTKYKQEEYKPIGLIRYNFLEVQ